jgi:hypothetical protein
MKTVAALALVAFAGVASAAETLNLGSFLQTSTVGERNITGQLTGSGYTSLSVSVDWTSVSGAAWSNEAIWAVTDAPLATAVEFYADPGPAGNSAGSTAPVTLTWNTFLSSPVGNSSPLWFLSLQTFSGSSANWSNVRLTFGNDTAPTPSAVDLGVVANESDIFNIGSEASDFDTEIGLYSSTGALLANDDDSGAGLTSLISGNQLDAGTYYLAVAGYNSTFSPFFGVTGGDEVGNVGGLVNNTTFSGEITAPGQVLWYSFTVTPTPGAISVLAMGGVIAGRRRRN